MKKIIRKVALFALMAVIVFSSANTYAASTVTVAGGDKVSGGEVFTVKVTFDGDSIGRVVGDITYDTDMLAYISGGSSSGNVGYVELRNAGTGEPLVFDLKFQALKEGSTELVVSASEMYDLNEGYMDTPSTTKTVTVSGDADEEEIIEETTEADTAADEGESVDEKESIGAVDTEEDSNGFLAKAIMFGLGILVLILLIAMLLRRKR